MLCMWVRALLKWSCKHVSQRGCKRMHMKIHPEAKGNLYIRRVPIPGLLGFKGPRVPFIFCWNNSTQIHSFQLSFRSANAPSPLTGCFQHSCYDWPWSNIQANVKRSRWQPYDRHAQCSPDMQQKLPFRGSMNPRKNGAVHKKLIFCTRKMGVPEAKWEGWRINACRDLGESRAHRLPYSCCLTPHLHEALSCQSWHPLYVHVGHES